MSSKTKIVVLHMKELVYTGIFVLLGILLIIFLLILFVPGDDTSSSSDTTSTQSEEMNSSSDVSVSSGSLYIPGLYNTELILNDQAINVEVIVNQSEITSVKLVNLSEAITTMYPLLEPTFDSIAEQIYETQSIENISYASEHKYTSLVLLEAIRKSLEKAQP
ncbi:MAG: hypothetical protein IKL22_06065 [Lachnospiraceae bacterium]|nr:hypothetical protein [Lachnospiraceae bacterium]